MGIVTWLKATDAGHWEMNLATGIARRTEKLVSGELDACATCHARRKILTDTPAPGSPLLDRALPALLQPGLYHADGQIDGEVFEYGSFVQSRMHQAGVTCSDCHEPHTARLRAEGNALCAQCHMPARFDTAAHTHHQPASAGAQCANCHMPAKTYMIVDPRHDHSIRVPRPDLSVAIGTPNACTQCHSDRTPGWAAQAVAGWFPGGRQTQPHFGTVLNAGRAGAANAEKRLDQLILTGTAPGIARATALALLPGSATAASDAAINAAIRDPDPLVRAAAPRALSAATSPATRQAMLGLLADPVRAVRVEAARALADLDPLSLNPVQTAAFATATRELTAAELVDAERPEAHLNLGLLAQRARDPTEAEAQYQTALRLDPAFVPAMVNLADLDRARGADAKGEMLLRQALALEPDNADIHHSLGLLLIRAKKTSEAAEEIRKAAELAPDNARYAYVYAVVLNATGSRLRAVDVLQRTHQAHPADWDVLTALTLFARDAGDFVTALKGATDMVALRPQDRQAWQLMSQLQKLQPR
jgi:predicted CXXCH cytochrome family protein